MYGSQAWPYICLLFSGFSNVCHSAAFWPTALKLGCITNFDMLSLVIGFISLVNEIQFMLISSRHRIGLLDVFLTLYTIHTSHLVEIQALPRSTCGYTLQSVSTFFLSRACFHKYHVTSILAACLPRKLNYLELGTSGHKSARRPRTRMAAPATKGATIPQCSGGGKSFSVLRMKSLCCVPGTRTTRNLRHKT